MSTATKWDAVTVRKTFIDYFTKEHGHTFVPSAKVVPYEDPTLLFVNSGMVQVSILACLIVCCCQCIAITLLHDSRVFIDPNISNFFCCVFSRMIQYKPLFLGTADTNTDFGKLKRAANSQKCIRAGGKHNGRWRFPCSECAQC